MREPFDNDDEEPFLKCLPCGEAYSWLLFPDVTSAAEAWDIINAKDWTDLVCMNHDWWKDD